MCIYYILVLYTVIFRKVWNQLELCFTLIFFGGGVCKFVSYKILIILEEIFASIIIYFAWYMKNPLCQILWSFWQMLKFLSLMILLSPLCDANKRLYIQCSGTRMSWKPCSSTYCVTSGMLHTLSVPRFPHL